MAKKHDPAKSVKAQIERLQRKFQSARKLVKKQQTPSKTIESGRVGISQAGAERLGRDAVRLVERAIAKGISPEQAVKMAIQQTQRKAATLAGGATAGVSQAPLAAQRQALAAITDVRQRDLTPLTTIQPLTGPADLYQPGSVPAITLAAIVGRLKQIPSVPQPTTPEEEELFYGPGGNVPEDYRWRQVLTREEYREKFGTERDVSPRVGFEPSTATDARIIYGPHPCNHEGHLRKNGKPCGHWAMQIYLVGTPGGDHPGIEFTGGRRFYYPSKTESDYRAALNAESTSYWCWDNGIRPRGGTPYISF